MLSRRKDAFPAIACFLAFIGNLPAQGTSGPSSSDSKVGYIDSALLMNQFRLRYDAGYNLNASTRAEWFYAKTAPGPGLPRPESRIDYQDLSAYFEGKVAPRFSVFLDTPYRFLNPEINANASGFGDLQVGCKYALLERSCAGSALTFQLRTYVPTGNAERGLGTHHVSLEPGLLYFKPVTDRIAIESEFRYWLPIGGTDFAGDLLRYGVGAHYKLAQSDRWSMTPVVEFVGWTMLGGKKSTLIDFVPRVESAVGDTIVNAKVGVRWGVGDQLGVYTGYGRSLTGDRWYDNTFRVELRYAY